MRSRGRIYLKNTLKDSSSTVKTLLKKYHIYWKKYNPIPSQKQTKNQEIIYGLCQQLLPEYLKRWDGDFLDKYTFGNDTIKPKTWIDLEERYETSYIYPDGKKTFLLAIFDGIFYDKKKKLWIFETKTKSRIDEEIIQDMILHDPQIMMSLWIARYVLVQIPAGVLYNVVRRPGQKLLKDETLNSFFGRVKKEVSNPKRYDHYFKRWEFAIDWSEVRQWKKDFLDPVMEEIRMWFEGNLSTYTNPYALVNQYGKCDMYLPIVKNDFTYCSRRRKYRK